MHGLLRIGQVSKWYGISLDTLRHYDRKGLLEPIVDAQVVIGIIPWNIWTFWK
ncbi:MerR family transcriptional regulator [Lacrimispora sp. BS-2]|uniref:MerR family transcriptional regulator n=1 Tax=Lacrimispora sp. BS-2 TaxID=3151850 RepID=UPI0032EC2BF4